MEIMNGPALKYTLVYKLFPRKIMTRKKDGFYHENGYKRGHLVKSERAGQIMYHDVHELMRFKCEGL